MRIYCGHCCVKRSAVPTYGNTHPMFICHHCFYNAQTGAGVPKTELWSATSTASTRCARLNGEDCLRSGHTSVSFCAGHHHDVTDDMDDELDDELSECDAHEDGTLDSLDDDMDFDDDL